MNFSLVFNLAGRVLTILGISMIPSLAVALYYGESGTPFLYPILLLVGLGLLLGRLPHQKSMFAREGFFSVGLIWVMTGLAGALPFYLSGNPQFTNFIDCAFESISGFTTTGSSILTDIEALPRGILFWRSFTHWLGGMGILVLFTALLPSMKLRPQFLTMAESTGPVFSKLVPRQSSTSKILYSIYFGLSAVEVVVLRVAGMPLYDSFIHTFSSAGTGGFSCKNLSVGAYANPVFEMIIAVFILLFSVNFALYFLLFARKFKDIFRSDELRFFLAVVALATLFMSINIYPIYQSAWQSFRFAFFQVSNIISTTGFAAADYMTWPVFSQLLVLLLMVCGACAGSTGGGVKCSRVLLTLRSLAREVRQIIHPRSTSVVRLNGKVVDEAAVRSTLVFLSCYAMICLLATAVVSLDNFSFATCFSSVLTCMSNTGPGLDMVGPAGNFSALSSFSKLVLSFCMVMGRLDLFPILVLFSRRAWQKT